MAHPYNAPLISGVLRIITGNLFMPIRDWLISFFPERQTITWREKTRISVATGISILLTGMISSYFLTGLAVPLLAISMGASAVLLFGVPGSLLSQPWPFIGGHLVSAAVGIACARWVGDPWLAAGLAVGLSMGAMLSLRCLHPPGGAIALFVVLGGQQVEDLGFLFLLEPLAINLLVMLALALVINNVLPGHHYPAPRHTPNVHKSADANPLERMGLSHGDIEASLRNMGVMVDVSTGELESILRGAQMLAAERRLGEVLCRDIMSSDIISVEFSTPLDEAWRLLYTHKIAALPVVDDSHRIIGIITLIDFLKAAQLNSRAEMGARLRELLKPSGKLHADKAEVVGQIMTQAVMVAREDMHIVALIELLSDKGMHHIPIINAEEQLSGMVTQSDLIAGLFHGVRQQGVV
jgi:CBS domain-containing membrane protein